MLSLGTLLRHTILIDWAQVSSTTSSTLWAVAEITKPDASGDTRGHHINSTSLLPEWRGFASCYQLAPSDLCLTVGMA